MTRWTRLLVMLVLVAFVAGSIAHIGNATTMNLKIAFAGDGDGGMVGCKVCPGDNDEMAPCDNDCMVPTLAVLPDIEEQIPPAERVARRAIAENLSGRTGPPEPYPPRTI